MFSTVINFNLILLQLILILYQAQFQHTWLYEGGGGGGLAEERLLRGDKEGCDGELLAWPGVMLSAAYDVPRSSLGRGTS